MYNDCHCWSSSFITLDALPYRQPSPFIQAWDWLLVGQFDRDNRILQTVVNVSQYRSSLYWRHILKEFVSDGLNSVLDSLIDKLYVKITNQTFWGHRVYVEERPISRWQSIVMPEMEKIMVTSIFLTVDWINLMITVWTGEQGASCCCGKYCKDLRGDCISL